MHDIDKFIKNINVPNFENEILFNSLEKELLIEIKKNEDKKNKKVKLNFISTLKYSFAFSIVVIILILTPIFIVISGPKGLQFSLISMNGNVQIRKNDKKEFTKINDSFKLSKEITIKTDKASSISFTAGNNYNINLNEFSEIKILDTGKNKNSEICRIYMIDGSAEYSVKLPTNDSVFQVDTEFSNFSVKGTRFIINIKKDERVELIVKEGKVNVSGYLKYTKNLNDIKKLDIDIYEKLSAVLNEVLIVEKDNSLIINKSDIDLLNNELNDNVYSKLINKNKIDDDEKKSIIDSLNRIYLNKNYFLHIVTTAHNDKTTAIIEDKIKPSLRITKTSVKLNTVLYEQNTSVTGGNNYLFITSDANNSIYCIDIKNNKIKWQFNDEKLKVITTPAISYKNEIVFGSPDFIYILNYDGSIKIKKEIKNGPVYWTGPIQINNDLFIPTSQTIYKYSGNDIIERENFPDLHGPTYISFHSNKLYFNDLNKKTIKSFDLSTNAISGESEELNNRAFMPPLVTDKYIIIIDTGGIIYRFDTGALNSPPKKLDIKYGVMSNIILQNDNLYFTSMDGNFYKTEINSFDLSDKIIKIDNAGNKDKYLTKKLLNVQGRLYYCAENGNLFYYDCIKSEYKFIEVDKSKQLTGSPVLISNIVYFFDTDGNLYALNF